MQGPAVDAPPGHFFKRLSEHREVTEDEEDRLSATIDRLYNLQEYPFTALELSFGVLCES